MFYDPGQDTLECPKTLAVAPSTVRLKSAGLLRRGDAGGQIVHGPLNQISMHDQINSAQIWHSECIKYLCISTITSRNWRLRHDVGFRETGASSLQAMRAAILFARSESAIDREEPCTKPFIECYLCGRVFRTIYGHGGKYQYKFVG